MSTQEYIPYGRQSIDEDDIRAVTDVLRSDWLTTGPKVDEFEEAMCGSMGAEHAVAVSSGTAALHAAMFAIGIGPGDEVIVPPMTFAATANCILYQGGVPVFADIAPDTLLLDPSRVEACITDKTQAIIAVDYAGQPCDYDALRAIADRYGLVLVADACHSLGAEYDGRRVGTLADLTAFSFHPVKHITTGEGGAVVTDRGDFADRMRRFRNHGISTDHSQRAECGAWFYEMEALGFNYRITDIQSALGISQLKKLPAWIGRRRALAARYDDALKSIHGIKPLSVKNNVLHAYHLYVVEVDPCQCGLDRGSLFSALRRNGVGVNVHYIPVHLHPYYRDTVGVPAGICPVAEEAYGKILTLPMFPAMEARQQDRVLELLVQSIESRSGPEGDS